MAGQVAVSATAKTKAAPSTGLPSFQFNLGIAWWGSVYGVVVDVMVVAIAVLIVMEVVDDLGCVILVVVLVYEAWWMLLLLRGCVDAGVDAVADDVDSNIRASDVDLLSLMLGLMMVPLVTLLLVRLLGTMLLMMLVISLVNSFHDNKTNQQVSERT